MANGCSAYSLQHMSLHALPSPSRPDTCSLGLCETDKLEDADIFWATDISDVWTTPEHYTHVPAGATVSSIPTVKEAIGQKDGLARLQAAAYCTYRVSDITQAQQDRLPWGGVCGRGGKANGHVSAPRGKGPASAALTSEQQLST